MMAADEKRELPVPRTEGGAPISVPAQQQQRRCVIMAEARHSQIHSGNPPSAFFRIAFLTVLLLQGCSSLNVENAAKLGTAGKEVSAAAAAGIFASDSEFRSAREAEIFFHSYTGVQPPADMLAAYTGIHAELRARKAVFTKLAAAYTAFSGLAARDEPARIAASIDELGDAVNGYAAAVDTSPVISGTASGIAGQIAHAALSGKKNRMLKQASALIRVRLARMLELLDDPLVREQMTGFRRNLARNRITAVQLLWMHGLLDPAPLLDQMAADAGLRAGSDAAVIVRNSKRIGNGLQAVMTDRLNNTVSLIDKGYDSTLDALRELIAEHEKLEKGESVTNAQLLQIIYGLQTVTERLSGRQLQE